MAPEKSDPSTSAGKAKAEEAAEDKPSEAAAGPSSSAVPNEPPPPAYEAEETAVPTLSSPFNFPPESDLPPYEPPVAGTSNQRPVAIPQLKPDPAIPFISTYPPSLLSHGVTQEKWYPFLDTISAFLTAKVSDRAISHAGDMAKHLTENSKQFGKDLFAETKSVGKGIAKSVKRGDVVGAAGGALGGIISLPLSFTFGLVDTVLALPASAVGAIVKKPKTPGQRAAAYAAVANEKWLHARGLHAHMLDSTELAQLLGTSATDLLKPAQETKDRSASGQLEALEGRIAPLEVKQEQITLELATNTIWLVLAPMVRQGEAASGS